MNKFKFGDKVLNSDGVLGVVTNEIDGLCFIAWTCHELDEGWYRESELIPATNWVKCEDKSPPFNTYVLIWDGEDQHVDWLSDTAPNEFKESHITHWMPLPSPPMESEQ